MKNLIIIFSLLFFCAGGTFGQKIIQPNLKPEQTQKPQEPTQTKTPVRVESHTPISKAPKETQNAEQEKLFGINPCKIDVRASYNYRECGTIEVEFSAFTGNNNIVRVHWKKSNSGTYQRQTYNNVGWGAHSHVINGVPGQSYDIYVEAKRGSLCPNYKGIMTAQLLTVRPCNTSNFTINGSSGSEVDICTGESITLDGSASNYENAYIVKLQQVSGSNTPIGGQISKYYIGQVPSNFDVENFAQLHNFSLIGGKRYKITLETRNKPAFSSKILNFLPATIDFQPNASLKSGTTDKYNRCGSLALYLNTSGSSCTSRYFVEIVEVDQWNNEVAGTKFSGWITPFSPLPNTLDITQIYTSRGFNFQFNKTYRVKVAVGFPWADKTIWVSFFPVGNCPLNF